MLHSASHYTPIPVAEEVQLCRRDKDVLRRLAGQWAEIAALPVHREKARMWQKLNDLESHRSMVWMTEVCWHEMDVNGELTLETEHPWAQEQERGLRRTLYQWRHMPCDMIVSDFLTCPLAIHSTAFGIVEDVDIARHDASSDIYSRHFHIQIQDFSDLEKIKMPVVTHNPEATEFSYHAMCDVYKGILPVKKVGQTHIWYTPWDFLIRWWGLEQAMFDLTDRPALVHAAVERLANAWMVELDQLEQQNLLSLDSNNTRIGSGGYGYTRELPGADFDPGWVKPHNMWGCSNAQIFSGVSPEMHWEFAIEHDLPWLSRWGLAYYGCCEALDRKVEVLRRIPNLRKISASPWCNVERLIDKIGDDYVISRKPNPAVLAHDVWQPELAREELQSFLESTGGDCHVEFIMKDISTVRYQPQRLWEWASIAMEVVEGFAGAK
jgi:hypothetical protein